VEEALHSIQTNRQADIAMPLAGYPSGFIHSAGKRVLVTENAKALPGKDVPWTNLQKFLTQLLGEEALPYQLLWWSWARRNIGNPLMLPGQCPFYIGESSIGKSLLQHRLTTTLLGGLSGDPYDAMTGGTSFNSELFEAVHLIIEDREFSRSHASRRDFGSQIKQMAVNTVRKCHPKGKPGVMLTPKWRCSISLNTETETVLAALPPLDDSILDKIMIFKCSRPEYPVDMGTQSGWKAWSKIIEDELPGLAFHCDQMEFGQYAAPRYGVRAWHDPTIMEQERESSPENILLEIMRNDLPTIMQDKPEWAGTSTDLCSVLCGSAMNSHRLAQKVLGHYAVQNCGTYLGRLAKTNNAITKQKIMGTNRWHITVGEL